VALTQLIVLGVLHAAAETLPIGAVAHLAWLDGWVELSAGAPNTRGLGLGLHLGLMLAAAAYFWRDLSDMATGLVRVAKGKRDPNARLAFLLIVATLPMIAAAMGVQHMDVIPWQSPMVVAWTAVTVSVLLLVFDSTCMTVKRIEHAGYSDAIILGLAQALAVIPGVGRIAVIVAVARALGYERQDAPRFAFLISIPTLFAASAWNAYGLTTQAAPFPTRMVLFGVLVAFATSLPTIALLMNWLRRSTFTPFALYRLVMSANLVAFAYGWI